VRISRFFVDHPLAQDLRFELPDDVAHHLVRVLRSPAGTRLRLFNMDGVEFEATLCEVAKRSASVICKAPVETAPESPIRTTLYQALSKGERMDYAIQKSTELGVSRIQLLNTQRVDVRLGGDRLEKRMQHWRRVAIAAAEQCGRASVPELLPPVDWPVPAPHPGASLILDPDARNGLGTIAAAEDFAIAVGPEGGFGENEVHQGLDQGWTGIRFGPRILRTETAGPAMLAALQSRWGDLQGALI